MKVTSEILNIETAEFRHSYVWNFRLTLTISLPNENEPKNRKKTIMRTLAFILLILDTLLVGFIAVMHVYWIGGGQAFAGNVLPEYAPGDKHRFFDASDRPNGTPPLWQGFIIVGLFVAYIVMIWFNYFDIWHLLIEICMWIATAVFAIRSIGDFNACGLFKRHKGTNFAHWDTVLYTPICIWLAITTALQVLL